jgi:hypothetical protein
LTSNLSNFSNLTNLTPSRAYLRSEHERASGFTCKFKQGSSFLSGALRFLTGLFVRLAGLFLFYQVQMANSWRESIFSLAIYFSELPNHDICQVNFGKLLEMLLPSFYMPVIDLPSICRCLCREKTAKPRDRMEEGTTTPKLCRTKKCSCFVLFSCIGDRRYISIPNNNKEAKFLSTYFLVRPFFWVRPH